MMSGLWLHTAKWVAVLPSGDRAPGLLSRAGGPGEARGRRIPATFRGKCNLPTALQPLCCDLTGLTAPRTGNSILIEMRRVRTSSCR
jgi:hypothetical protein